MIVQKYTCTNVKKKFLAVSNPYFSYVLVELGKLGPCFNPKYFEWSVGLVDPLENMCGVPKALVYTLAWYFLSVCVNQIVLE